MNWNHLKAISDLEKVDEISKSHSVLIFKHSTRCSISAASLDRLERKWNEESMKNCRTYFLDLIRHREVSNAIAQKYDVVHQSPQIMIIKDGRCVYEASHFGIDYEEIQAEASKLPA